MKIEYECGHIETREVTEEKAAALRDKGKCYGCWLDALFEKQHWVSPEGLSLVQINFARDVIRRQLNKAASTAERSTLRAATKSGKDAEWWIDRRDLPFDELVAAALATRTETEPETKEITGRAYEEEVQGIYAGGFGRSQ
jgi:hypothetical protein